jgi:hypothetical protein
VKRTTRKQMSESHKRRWAEMDSETRERISEAIKRSKADPEVRKRMSKAMKGVWKRPEYRQNASETSARVQADPAIRRSRGELIKLALARPDVKMRHSEGIKRALATPAARRRKSRASKLSWATNPVRRQRQSEVTRGLWAERKRLLGQVPSNRKRGRPPEPELIAYIVRLHDQFAGRREIWATIAAAVKIKFGKTLAKETLRAHWRHSKKGTLSS